MEYYIKGSPARADEIKAAFEAKGFIPRIAPMYYGSESVLFFTGTDNYIYETTSPWVMDIIKTHPDYKELELPKPHYDISNFYAGMPVLVRDNNKEWRYVPFSHITNGSWKFNAVGTIWEQCIPFKGNEHLLGTTDMCDEQYINW